MPCLRPKPPGAGGGAPSEHAAVDAPASGPRARLWTARELGPTEPLDAGLGRVTPDLLVVDSGDFPARCHAQLGAFPPGRVIVIGPEPLAAYRQAAPTRSAGAWLPREAISDELSVAMRRILGCSHAPCPTARAPQEDTVSSSDKV